MTDMILKEKIYKVYLWTWKIEKKHPVMPMSEDEWSEIIDGVDQIVKDLNLKQGSYPRILLVEFLHAKERYETVLRTA